MTCFTSRLLTFSVTKPDPCLFLCLQINRKFPFLARIPAYVQVSSMHTGCAVINEKSFDVNNRNYVDIIDY